MYGAGFDGMFTAFAIICMVIGGAIVGICFWLIPWLWSLVKPWLHVVTA